MRVRALSATADPAAWLVVAAGLATAVAVWLRLAPLFSDFAFGDGGLFWVMANDLRDNGFLPPELTTFNAGDIPWVYPPLGIYLVALLGGDGAVAGYLSTQHADQARIGNLDAMLARNGRLVAAGADQRAYTGIREIDLGVLHSGNDVRG